MEVSGKVGREIVHAPTPVDNCCNPCSVDGQQITADGFCHACNDYLCVECIRSHRKFRMLRNHRISRGSEMPTTMPLEAMPYTENCTKHPDEVLKYFCGNHVEFCCGPCILDHRSCKLESIKDLAKDFQRTKEFKNISSDIAGTLLTLTELEANESKMQKKAEDIQNKVIADIDSFYEFICKQMSKHVDKLHQKVKEIANKNQTEIKEISVHYATARNKFLEIQQQLSKCNSDIELFMNAKRLVRDTPILKKTALEMKQRSVLTDFSFKPSARLTELVLDLNSAGDIVAEISNSSEDDANDTETFEWANASLNLTDSFSIKHYDDKNKPYATVATGMCFIDQDILLLADNSNKAIKLVDIVNRTLSSILYTDGYPWDVTRLSEDQAAATCGNLELIKILSTRGGLTTVRDIKVNGDCSGICYIEGQLIVSFNSPGKCEVMDLDGTVYRVITNDKMDHALHINAFCSNGIKFIYTSLWFNGNIVKTNATGDMISLTPDCSFKRPRQPIFLAKNIFAVADEEKDYISIVLEESGGMEIIKKLKADHKIGGVAYSPAKKSLYTCSEGSGIVNVWNITME